MKIQKLELISNNLEKQKEFYREILSLEIIEEAIDFVSFRIGQSILILKKGRVDAPYHYAINIPSNQEQEAYQWLKDRVEVLKDGRNELQYFDFWDAYAIYFLDADQNIVELIARRTLNSYSNEEFSQKSMLGISEIGIATEDIGKVYEWLRTTVGLSIYSGSVDRFCAIGDEDGMFIVVNSILKKKWYPTNVEPVGLDFRIKLENNQELHSLEYSDGKWNDLEW